MAVDARVYHRPQQREPDPAAPLPLEWDAALERAVQLRRRGMSNATVSLVMSEYHGWWLSSWSWAGYTRRHGAPVDQRKQALAVSQPRAAQRFVAEGQAA